MGKAVLIFPAGMPRALDFLIRLQADGLTVIGASSLAQDPVRERYPSWLTLPYVTEPEFDDALARAIGADDIGSIYTPHPVVWGYLSRELERIAPGVQLLGASPVDTELKGFRAARTRARDLLSNPLRVRGEVEAKPQLTEVEAASLYLHTDSIPGMCDHEKMRALCAVARLSPPGDVVEIGTWWGKSAFLLLRLAQCYGIGRLLCVDPWSDGGLVQNDETGLLDVASSQYSSQEAFEVFLMNLLPYAKGDLNYLRMPSVEGAAAYRANSSIQSPEFGQTSFSGRIALLHLDGNHTYENIRADIDAWTGLVMDGGWIIIDDYVWPFGDGPKRAGDEFVAENQGRITTSFVLGSALFLWWSRA